MWPAVGSEWISRYAAGLGLREPYVTVVKVKRLRNKVILRPSPTGDFPADYTFPVRLTFFNLNYVPRPPA